MKTNINISAKVEKREEKFVEKASTAIWQEIPTNENPYIAQRSLCHGYDVCELLKKRNFIEIIYLLFKTDLPSKKQSILLEKLMIGLCHPGLRHNATRAAMNAGVGKTEAIHILPIALTVMGGQYLGAGEVQSAMRFLKNSQSKKPEAMLDAQSKLVNDFSNGDLRIAPGFGSYYGGIDPLANQLALMLCDESTTKTLDWGVEFSRLLENRNQGWLMPGVAAAAFLDLGFDSRTGAALFQLFSAPGLLAQGLEMSSKPITAMPFLKQENYLIDESEDEI